MTTQLDFYVTVPLDRAAALDRRDEIIAKLSELGIRLNFTNDGLAVFMNDAGIPTISETDVSADVSADEIADRESYTIPQHKRDDGQFCRWSSCSTYRVDRWCPERCASIAPAAVEGTESDV